MVVEMKRKLHSALLAAAVGAGMMLVAGTASATVIAAPDATWYRFQFGSDTSGVDSTGGPAAAPVVSAPGAPPWTFDLRSWTTLSVTDAFLQGDQFNVFDFGALILSTSVVAVDGSNAIGADPFAGFASALFSSGTVGLAPGAHELTIQVSVSPFGGGAGYFRVPEPATLTLFAFGLLGLGFMMRRRRKTV